MKIDVDILKRIIDVPKDFGILGLNIEKNLLRIHNYSATEREQYHFTYELKGSVKEEMTLTLNPGTMAKIMKKFAKAKELTLEAEKNTLTINDGLGNEVTYIMPDQSEVMFVPEEEMPTIIEDVIHLPSEITDDEVTRKSATTIVTGELEDIMPAFVDMNIAEAEYFTLVFGTKASYSISGHWEPKGMKSRSPINVKVKGKKGEFTGDNTLKSILESINGAFEMQIGLILGETPATRVIDRETEDFTCEWTLPSITKGESE